MKSAVAACTALLFLAVGLYDILKEKRKTVAIDEIVRFVNFVKNEVHYRASDLETLITYAASQNYRYIKFEEFSILPYDLCDEKVRSEFSRFADSIGTTDVQGQLALCDEYLNRFSEILVQRKQKEKSKIQVNTALSVLSALCIIILSL